MIKIFNVCRYIEFTLTLVKVQFFLRSYIILMCICISCNRNDNNNLQIEIPINMEKEENIYLSDVVSDYYFVKLNNPENINIGEVTKVKIFKDKIYIMDERKAVALYIYDLKGNFISQINNKGKGPGEFISLTDFIVDTINDQIYISDTWQKKIIVYNANGSYVDEIKLDFLFTSFYLYKNKFYFDLMNKSFDGDLHTLIITDLTGKNLSRLISYDRRIEQLSITSLNPFQCINDTLLFLPTLNSNIYSIDSTQAKIKYFLNFKNNWPPIEKLSMNGIPHSKYLVENLENSDYVIYLSYIATPDIMRIKYFHHNKPISAFYSKKSNKVIIGESIIDDIGSGWFQGPLSSYGDYFIEAIEINEIKNRISNSKDRYQDSPVGDIIKDLNETENPILLFTKIDF